MASWLNQLLTVLSRFLYKRKVVTFRLNKNFILLLYSISITCIFTCYLTSDNKITKCSKDQKGHSIADEQQKPKIYIITPTYYRLEQTAEITRLCNTFLHVPNIHWIVIEDANQTSTRVRKKLVECEVPFTLLFGLTPSNHLKKGKQPRWYNPRGIIQRNLGLKWLRNNLRLNFNSGVLYFADDDNTYSRKLFEEIRTTKRVSTWPVAFAGRSLWEGCVVKSEHPGLIVRMKTLFNSWRPFPIDMAAFAINIDLILTNRKVEFSYSGQPGMLETNFLQQLGLNNYTQLEPKANQCKKILVWHTQTIPPMIINTPEHESQSLLFPDEL